MRIDRLALLALAVGAFAAPLAQAGELSAAEQAGRMIFFEGKTPSGVPIQALVGPHSTPVSAETLPCASCHGPDALGRPEGAVRPANITWPALTKPYGHRNESGRERGPYDDAKFAEALTFGTDPSGNRLDPAMPRYVMANADIANLLAYLKRIDSDFDPGLSADRLRVGTLLPAGGRMAEVGAAMREVMQAHVGRINQAGGVFGRQLELVVVDLPDSREGAERAAATALRDGRLFALVAPFAAGIEKSLYVEAEAARVPVIGPFTLAPQDDGSINRQTFYLLPGVRDQARALADFASKDIGLKNPRAVVLHPAGEAELAAAVVERLRERGWQNAEALAFERQRADANRLVGRMQQQNVEVIFYLGEDPDLIEFGREIRDAVWSPYLLALGHRSGAAAARLPTTFGNRVFLAYPTLPGDITEQGAVGLVPGKPGGRVSHLPARVAAYGAMLVFEEGIKRAGRNLSRIRLLESLERLFSFETGVMPTISFGPNRRVGTFGAHIVAVDLGTHRFRPIGRFVRLD